MLRFLLCLVGAGSVSAAPVDFARQVEPMLRAKCQGCHGAAQQMSGLRLDSRQAALAGGYSGPVIVPGKNADSKVIQRVSGMKGVMIMPPAGKPLSADEVALLKTWIDEGAVWPESAKVVANAARSQHWAFQPIARPAG